MAQINITKTLTAIIVLIVLGGVSYKWVYEKEQSTLYKEGDIIARYSWSLQAERTYILKNTWYNANVKCPKIIAMGGYNTSTRCYYPPDYYEDLKRSLINTKLIESNLTVTRKTPFYMYGTSGTYAGVLEENSYFVDTEEIMEFPKDYLASFSPKDTRNYKLVWKISNLKKINIPNGNYTLCAYNFDNIKIDLKDECSKLERAEVVNENKRVWFYFNPLKNLQSIDLKLIDPKGGETPLPPVENVEKRIIKDDVTDCLNSVCSATLGKVRFAPYKGKWYELEKAPSLNESSKIKCVVESDGVHLTNCLDFNYTHRLIDVSIKDVSLINKNIPIKVLKINQSYLDKQLEEGKEIDKERMYSTVSETNYNFKDLKEIKQEWIKADFSDIIEIGENSTTIQINSSSNNLADIQYYDNNARLASLIKWNISSIPPLVTIDNCNLHLFIIFTPSSPDNDITIWYINNQNWDEVSGANEAKLNAVNTTLSSILAKSWTYVNITSQFIQSYVNGNKNFTIGFEDQDYALTSYNGFTDNNYLIIGIDDGTRLIFEDRENTGGTYNYSYLNVTYSEDTTPPSFSNSQTNASSTTYNGTTVQINLTITDNTAVDFYRLTVNDTSNNVWVNQTLVDANNGASVTAIFNYTIRNFSTSGGTLGWRVWANDTAGNINVSNIYTFVVAEIPTAAIKEEKIVISTTDSRHNIQVENTVISTPTGKKYLK